MAGGAPAWAKASGSSAAIQNEDAARIDWRQSAKSQHLFVREREWEAAQTVWFWRDGGAGMDFSSGGRRQARTGASFCCWRWRRFWCAAASGWDFWAAASGPRRRAWP